MSHAAIPSSIPSTIAPYLSLITERIVQPFQPLKIILFGSYARGDATTNSDLDSHRSLPTLHLHVQPHRASSVSPCLTGLSRHDLR